MITTVYGDNLDDEIVSKYFSSLINNFFKILPMSENQEDSLHTYMRSLQIELLGGNEYIPDFKNNPSFLSLLFILQYFIDNPDTPLPDVKREVFKAIRLCNRLKDIYMQEVRHD